jgi:hypothetical protein
MFSNVMARARLRQFATRNISLSDENIVNFYEHLDSPIEMNTLNLSYQEIGCVLRNLCYQTKASMLSNCILAEI